MYLPAETLAPGACLLVSCEQMHLSRSGATLELWNANSELVDTVRYDDAPSDQSLIRTEDGALVPCRWPSPGQENRPEGYDAYQDTLSAAELVIHEAVVYNPDFFPIGGETYDWVELKNTSDRALSLSEYSLTDKHAVWGNCMLPELTLQPGELVTLLCGAPENDELPVLPFSLSSSGDELFLIRRDGSICGAVLLGVIPLGGSVGRMDDRGGFFYFAVPTPGEDNGPGFRRITEKPASAENGGVFENVENVTVTLSGSGEIRYTLDGSLPTEESELYTGPLTLDSTAVVRARCFEEGALPGKTLDLSCFINEGHTLPVVSVIAEPDSLFSSERGIYQNPEENWEVPASAVLFADERGFETIDCGLKIHGAKSRTNQLKKSFKLCFRSRYGGELDCDLFENGVTEFSSVLLRAAWESSISTEMRDILMHELGSRLSDKLPTQDYRYCALYINGEYWGLYALREAHSEEHYARHFGFDPESVSMWQGGWPVGPAADELWACLVKDLRDEAAYAEVVKRLDIESVIAWSIIQSYSGNLDMNSPNMRFYRSTEDGLLRYVLVDLDLGFFTFGEANLSFRTGNRYSEAILRLMDNPDFRALYIRRLSEALHGPLTDESFLSLVDRLSDETRDEAPRDYRRWKEDPRDRQHEIDTYLIGSTGYPGGHVGMLARSARSQFHITDEEWEALFADLDA